MIRLPECPICGKAVAAATDPGANFAPFCSRRCKEVDLIRWCEGRYAIIENIDPNRAADLETEEIESNFEGYSEQGADDDDEGRFD